MITEHLITKAKAYISLAFLTLSTVAGVLDAVPLWMSITVAVLGTWLTYRIPNAEPGYDWGDEVGDDVRPEDEMPDDPGVAGRH
ncbi:MAG: hypothetical protein L0K86_26105 [Actinomycetia bacterium]|nr:hypothetical protein [Actinomycetes bacterium]